MRRFCTFLLPAVALFFGASSGAVAQVPAAPEPLLGIDSERGLISLGMLAPPGSAVRFFELVDGRRVSIGEGVAQGGSDFPSASIIGIRRWSCRRLERRFTAVATAPDGTVTTAGAETRTPDCRTRVEVEVPARVARGAVLNVRVSDRFFSPGGVRTRVCAGPIGHRARCRSVGLTERRPARTARFRVGRDALWRVRVRHIRGTLERVIRVGNAKRPAGLRGLPSLLVTGDSLIQGIDAIAADRLQTAFDVAGDSRPGTGLTKTGFDWPATARAQIARLRPEVAVLSLGISDGVPIDGIPCCGSAWSERYAERAGQLMDIYARRGRGQVLWLVPPISRNPELATIIRAVGRSVRRAAAGRRGVTLIPLDELLTPGSRYRDTVKVGGRALRVRAADGVHLSVAGSRLVTGLIVDTLRRIRPTG